MKWQRLKVRRSVIKMAEPVIIDLLRHGEVQGTHWVFRGSTDVALSQTGWLQMQTVAEQVSSIAFSQIASSPLSRCRLFAESFAAQQNTSCEMLTDMREMDFGGWEGHGAQHIGEAELHQFLANPVGFCPPQGESFDSFAARVIKCWQTWLQDADGEHRLLVAHGGVMRVLLAFCLDMPLASINRLHVPYAAWSRISLLEGERPRVLFMNRGDTCAD